jgi:hypothetical protein
MALNDGFTVLGFFSLGKVEKSSNPRMINSHSTALTKEQKEEGKHRAHRRNKIGFREGILYSIGGSQQINWACLCRNPFQ